MMVSIKKQILTLILAGFSLSGACESVIPDMFRQQENDNPTGVDLTVNDLEQWNKENLVVAKNEKELLAHYVRHYQHYYLENESYGEFFSRFWAQFVSCIASNPFNKEQISLFDAGYNHVSDYEQFYFLYGLPGGNAWSVDSKKIDEISANFYTMIKAYPKLKDYMTPEMYKYHPITFAERIYRPRLMVCTKRARNVYDQMLKAQAFYADPLNKAKGLKYQYQYEGTTNRKITYMLYNTLIRKDEDVNQYVYEYSLKGTKK